QTRLELGGVQGDDRRQRQCQQGDVETELACRGGPEQLAVVTVTQHPGIGKPDAEPGGPDCARHDGHPSCGCGFGVLISSAIGVGATAWAMALSANQAMGPASSDRNGSGTRRTLAPADR